MNSKGCKNFEYEPAIYTTEADTAYHAVLRCSSASPIADQSSAAKASSSHAKQQGSHIYNQYLHGRHIPMRFYRSFLITTKLVEQGSLSKEKSYDYYGSRIHDVSCIKTSVTPIRDEDIEYEQAAEAFEKIIFSEGTGIYDLMQFLQTVRKPIPCRLFNFDNLNEKPTEFEMYEQFRSYYRCSGTLANARAAYAIEKSYFKVLKDLMLRGKVTSEVLQEFKKYFKFVFPFPGCFSVHYNCTKEQYLVYKRWLKICAYRRLDDFGELNAYTQDWPTSFIINDRWFKMYPHNDFFEFAYRCSEDRARKNVICQYLGVPYNDRILQFRLITWSHYITFVDSSMRDKTEEFLYSEKRDNIDKYFSIEKIANYMKTYGLKLF